MKRCVLWICAVVLSVVLVPPPLFAEEPPQAERKLPTPFHNGDPSCKCTPLSQMALTEAQGRDIDQIAMRYNHRILQLRSQIMLKQMELIVLLRNPETGDKDILAAATEIGAVRSELEVAGVQCQLEIRKLLTPEQIRVWCNLENPSLKKVW